MIPKPGKLTSRFVPLRGEPAAAPPCPSYVRWACHHPVCPVRWACRRLSVLCYEPAADVFRRAVSLPPPYPSCAVGLPLPSCFVVQWVLAAASSGRLRGKSRCTVSLCRPSSRRESLVYFSCIDATPSIALVTGYGADDCSLHWYCHNTHLYKKPSCWLRLDTDRYQVSMSLFYWITADVQILVRCTMV